MIHWRINGPLIKKLREANGLSHFQVGIDTGLQPGTISKLETGTQRDGNGDTIRKLAEYFGMRMEDLQIQE